MEKIAFASVRKTYNGRKGCACGCNGKYTLPGHVSVEEGNKEVGWDAYSESDISDRRAKIALSKVNKAIEEYGPLAKDDGRGNCQYTDKNVWFCYSDTFAAITFNDRTTAVYF